MTNSIVTPRLLLRRFREADADAYFELFRHPDVERFLVPMPDIQTAREHIQFIEAQRDTTGYAMFAVELKETSQLIGRVGPWKPDHRPGTEISWTIHPSHGRRGYAVEAARASMDWFFSHDSEAHRVIHCIDADNLASQSTAIKLGGHLTSEIFDHPMVGPIPVWETLRPID